MVTDRRFNSLVSAFGDDAATLTWKAGAAAIELIEWIVNQQKIPTVNNTPLILIGNGIPSADTKPSNWPSSIPWDGVPVFIGQIYLDITATSGGAYHAVGNESIANWIS